MALTFCSFSSGSSGNCYLIKSEETALLVDAGISLKRIREGLAASGTPEEAVSAVLVTHEHSDHIRSIGAVGGKRGLGTPRIYANAGTWNAISKLPAYLGMEIPGQTTYVTGEDFTIGDITVHSFPVSHDAAEPVGYSFRCGESCVAIITDTGVVTPEIYEEACRANLLVLESNHDVEMLKFCRYPWFLKQRILGESGHLSNELAAQTVLRMLQEGKAPARIALAHLSRENNFPEMAWQTMKNVLEEEDYTVGRDVAICTLVRDEISEVMFV
ncbi:MAG: MBL fold metallo-hydrolase [Firmicutes bacterium]|nr:MBL fold metallo-hydrolase [Bacillota bacterium]